MTRAVFYLAGILSITTAAYGQLIVNDNFNVTSATTGFALDNGANFGINPPATRLTGSAASGLQYLYTQVTGTPKLTTFYSITGNKLSVARSANSGRFSLSANGTTALDFGSYLTSGLATPANKAEYDIKLSMANSLAGGAATVRFSFGLGTIESDATTWDFGFQLYRAVATDDFYTIQKRIDIGSSGLADQNLAITTTGAGTYGNQLAFLMRVTDAGAESGGNYNSRVQLSLDNGGSWFYDTSTDGSLVNGWRLDGAGRFLIFDQAGAGSGSGAVTYDNFSVTVNTAAPEPSVVALGILGGVAILLRRRR